MASNPANSISKTSNASLQISSVSSSQSGQSAVVDSHAQRRGGSGSFGAGASTRAAVPTPRNKQASKNQHKSSRRYRFADEDAIAETAAMRSTSSRKGQTSITHLMNFSLPPRPQRSNQHINHQRYGRHNPTWGLGSGYHAIDKARYVHANYRFVVDPRKDYKAQSVDADVYLEWSNILQILASPQSQAAACPICLGEPVAPRMAKCGHIFCLPCLIRYMHASDDSDQVSEKRAKWKKCPICWDSVYMSDTKPVRWYQGQEGSAPKEGADVVLRLVMRPAGNTVALPRERSYSPNTDEDIPWHFAVDVMDYARVMKGSEEYMMTSYDDELRELHVLEKHDEVMFGEDTEWTGKAIRMIHDAKEKSKGIGNAPAASLKVEEAKPKRPPIVFQAPEEGVPDMYRVQHEAKSGHDDTSSVASNTQDKLEGSSSLQNPEEIPQANGLASTLSQLRAQPHSHHSAPPSDYYFYQALLHYYLSPLDIRILKTAFGEFSAFPSTILPRVEHVSTGHVVDDELRRRTKYLSHLPYGCEVSFLECDWTDTVPPAVIQKFRPEIEKRRKKNHEKEVREEKERVRAEKEEEDKRYAAARRKRPSISQDTFQPDDFQPLTPPQDAARYGPAEGWAESPSPILSFRKPNGSSFATLASPSTSPNARTVWGTTAIAPLSPTITAIPPDITNVDDGWLQGWESELLREEDLVAQVEAASFGGESSKAGASSGGKKKKGKKITLMSTNVRRGA